MHEATIGRFIPGQHVTNGRHLCRVTDTYGLEYLDGTGYGAKLDDSWQVVAMDAVGAPGTRVSLDTLADALNHQNALIEPEHRFGDVYLLGRERVACVFPGTANAWATAYAKRRLTWAEVTENLETRYGVEPQGNFLGGDRFTLDAVRERPSFGCVTPLGGGVFAIYAFPGTRRPWAVSGTRSRKSFADLEVWEAPQDDQGPTFAGQMTVEGSPVFIFNTTQEDSEQSEAKTSPLRIDVEEYCSTMLDAVRDRAGKRVVEAVRDIVASQVHEKGDLSPLPDMLMDRLVQPGVKIAQDLADKIPSDALDPLALARESALKIDEAWHVGDSAQSVGTAFDRLLRRVRQEVFDPSSEADDDLTAAISDFHKQNPDIQVTVAIRSDDTVSFLVRFRHNDGRFRTVRYPSRREVCEAVREYTPHPESIFGETSNENNLYGLGSRYTSAFPGSTVSMGTGGITINHCEPGSFIGRVYIFRDENAASAFIRGKLGL